MLLENLDQGQLQGVVAICRLPWRFMVGKRQGGQGALAAPADIILPFRNGASNTNEQYFTTGDTPTPRPCTGAEPRAPTPEPSSSTPLFPPEREYRAVSPVPSFIAQALAAPGLGSQGVAEPMQRKRGRARTDVSDEESRESTGGRRVRSRLGQWDDAPPGWLLSPSANQIQSRPFTTSVETGIPQGTALVSSSDGFHGPAASVTPWVYQPAPSLRSVQGYQSSARPDEGIDTVLHATNPRRGPVSGGIEIWLLVDGLPTTIGLYARFGTHVAATVSPIFHPPSPF